MRQTAEKLFFDAGLPLPANIVESLSVQTNVALMGDGQTVGLMPRSAAMQFAGHDALTILRVSALPAFGDIGCFSYAERIPAPAVQLFRTCLREAAAELGTAAPPTH